MARSIEFIRDLDDDPLGNVQHIAEHDMKGDSMKTNRLAMKGLVESRALA